MNIDEQKYMLINPAANCSWTTYFYWSY